MPAPSEIGAASERVQPDNPTRLILRSSATTFAIDALGGLPNAVLVCSSRSRTQASLIRSPGVSTSSGQRAAPGETRRTPGALRARSPERLPSAASRAARPRTCPADDWSSMSSWPAIVRAYRCLHKCSTGPRRRSRNVFNCSRAWFRRRCHDTIARRAARPRPAGPHCGRRRAGGCGCERDPYLGRTPADRLHRSPRRQMPSYVSRASSASPSFSWTNPTRRRRSRFFGSRCNAEYRSRSASS